MALPCGKRFITLSWCILECLFFSGLLNGWTTLHSILKEERYYLDSCNLTLFNALNSPDVTNSVERSHQDFGIDNPFTEIHEGVKARCVVTRVLKRMTLTEYERYKKMRSRPSKKPVTVHDVYCDEQDEKLEFVVSLVIIIRNILMLPLGVFLDRYGTSRTRIIAM